MAYNKSTGCDGLTAEFYKRHWKTVGQLVVNSFNEAYDNNELSASHKRGIITLIHKGKGLPQSRLLEKYYIVEYRLQNCCKNIIIENKQSLTYDNIFRSKWFYL